MKFPSPFLKVYFFKFGLFLRSSHYSCKFSPTWNIGSFIMYQLGPSIQSGSSPYGLQAEAAVRVYFSKQVFLKIFAIFTGKQLYWMESLFNEIADLPQQQTICLSVFDHYVRQACNFSQKRHQHRCFPMNTAKFLRIAFLQKTSGDCFSAGGLQVIIQLCSVFVKRYRHSSGGIL